MHMEWQLPLSLQPLLFGCDLRVTLDHNTLGQKLFLSATAADLLQSILRFINQIGPKSAETNLDKRSVEQDLSIDREVPNSLLQVRHQKHIARFIVLIMQSEVVDLTEVSSRSYYISAVLEKIGAQCLNKGIYIGIIGTRGDFRVELGGNGLPCGLFENMHHLGRLYSRHQYDGAWLGEVHIL